ncbi:MAG: MOSC domain-containing protein [Ktedonobacterales bacterium]|nr:MOSC domain-containing protein [Ktedonobacterales bacterium]
MHLSAMTVFPVKSLRGIETESAWVEARGLHADRRWLITNAQGDFLTQRTHPRMALVTTELVSEGVRCTAPGIAAITIPYEPLAPTTLNVTVWQSTCQAHIVDATLDQWFSDYLGLACHLVYMPETTRRVVNPLYAAPGDIVSFADGYPVLLAGQSSLDDLNARMAEPLPMARFRPNLVISGTDAFAEDTWARIRIGTVEFAVVKPCARCVMTTVDPARGEFAGKEPLRTLATYRRDGDKVLFGQNAIPRGSGMVRVGDSVEVIAVREPQRGVQ